MAAFVGTYATLVHGTGSFAVTIGCVRTMSGPSSSVGTVDSTCLGASAKTFLPTILDNGEVTFTVAFDPEDSTHTLLISLLNSPSVDSWAIILPDDSDTALEFEAMLTQFGLKGFDPEGLIEADCTLKISGAISIN